jgi:hypothetical protein
MPVHGILYNEGRRRIIQIDYRAHQIFHSFSNEIVFYFLPISLGSAGFILISSLYSAVKFWKAMAPPVLASLLIVTFTAVLLFSKIVPLGASITSILGEFQHAYKKNYHPTHQDPRFLSSCHLLKWKVGGLYEIKPNTFVIIMQDNNQRHQPSLYVFNSKN